MGRFIAASQLVVIVGAIIQMVARREKYPLTQRRVAECLLSWSLPVNTGVGGIMGFVGHTLRAKETAEEIGWPSGNPFQSEVALSDLAFGVLGFLSIWFRGSFWLATITGKSIFELGASYVHIREMVKNKNFHPGNAGPVLFVDALIPLAHIFLLRRYGPLSPQEKSTPWREILGQAAATLRGHQR